MGWKHGGIFEPVDTVLFPRVLGQRSPFVDTLPPFLFLHVRLKIESLMDLDPKRRCEHHRHGHLSRTKMHWYLASAMEVERTGSGMDRVEHAWFVRCHFARPACSGDNHLEEPCPV